MSYHARSIGGRLQKNVGVYYNLSQRLIKITARRLQSGRETTLVVGHDHIPGNGLVLGELLLAEPETDLLGGRLVRVRGVDDVAADRDAEVTTDGTGSSVLGVGGTHKATALTDDVLALPDHGNDGGTAGDVGDETGVEGPLGKVDVVLLGELLGGDETLDGDELVAALLEAGDDLTDDLARDTVGLDHDVRALGGSAKLTGDGLGALEVDRGGSKGRVGQSTTGSKSGSAEVSASGGVASGASSLGGEGTLGSGAESGDGRASEHGD